MALSDNRVSPSVPSTEPIFDVLQVVSIRKRKRWYELCGPLVSPGLFVGHVHTLISPSAAGLERQETVSSLTAPIPLYSTFSTSDAFLALSLGESAALLWPQ